MKESTALTLFVALTLACGLAIAADETPPIGGSPAASAVSRQGPGARFRAADVNGDLKVTLEEFKAAFPNQPLARFTALDRNGDGVLTHEEAPSNRSPRGGGQHPAMMLKQADKEGDQKVTAEEFRAAFPQATDERFKSLDRNDDGVLTSADFPQAEVQRADRPHPGLRTRPEQRWPSEFTFEQLDIDGNGVLSKEEFEKLRSGAKPRAEAGRPEKPRPDRFHAADTDNDGKVSLEEATAAGIPRERFKMRDTDGNGYITKEDRKPKDVSPAL